jgi:hypothetical protein
VPCADGTVKELEEGVAALQREQLLKLVDEQQQFGRAGVAESDSLRPCCEAVGMGCKLVGQILG